jgi:hypothetical protein
MLAIATGNHPDGKKMDNAEKEGKISDVLACNLARDPPQR